MKKIYFNLLLICFVLFEPFHNNYKYCTRLYLRGFEQMPKFRNFIKICDKVCVKCDTPKFRFVRNPTTNKDLKRSANRIFKVSRTGEDDAGKATDDNESGNGTEDVGSALLLTPYIEQGRLEEARNLSSVSPDVFLTYDSYSGFLTVDKNKSSHLFFWYFPITNDAVVADAPWIIWLQGGPGSSDLDGLFNEIGPVRVGKNDTLELNPHSWHHNHSLVFIDNPVGTGFSYTDDIDGYSSHMHTYSEPLYNAVKQLVTLFPELKIAPLFVAGESYAGKYVPALAMKIHDNKEEDGINFQGLMIGNGLLEPSLLKDSFKIYPAFGLIEKEQWDALDPVREAILKDIDDNKSFECSRKYNTLVYNYIQLAGLPNDFNFLANTMDLGNYYSFIDQPSIRRAIHVGSIQFTNFNTTVYDKIVAVDFLTSTRDKMETLLDHYRVLLYCGQLDLLVPCESTAKTIREYKWRKTEEFLDAPRDQWIYDDNLAGYQKSGGGLTWLVVRGAGHFVPADKPAEAQDMIARFTHSLPLLIVPNLPLQNLTQIASEYSVDQEEASQIDEATDATADETK